jgi:hypothetical protein
MLPDTKRRLTEAVEDIQSFFTEHAENTALTESEEWADGQTTMNTAVNGVLSPS